MNAFSYLMECIALNVKKVKAGNNTSRLLEGRWRNAEDWIEAGKRFLREEGVMALRVTKLSTYLAVSTGSFYHHFKDFDSFLTALADAYSEGEISQMVDSIYRETTDPLERIRRIGRESAKADIWKLSAAMTVWGASDNRAAAAVERGEDIMVAFLSEAFRDLGFDESSAALRGKMLVSLNVSHIVGSAALRAREYREEALALLIGGIHEPSRDSTA